jgi:hypothetical protein
MERLSLAVGPIPMITGLNPSGSTASIQRQRI